MQWPVAFGIETDVGALTEAGVSKDEPPLYAEGMPRGGSLVSAKVNEADRGMFDAIPNQSSVNLHDRSAAWKRPVGVL